MLKLRYYQEDASKAAEEADNGVIVLPTGAGKSLVIADIVNNTDGHVIVFQPSKEILEQNFKKITDFGFKDAKIFSASMNQKELGKATFATIGSVMNKIELFEHFEIVIIDECHLVNAKGGQYLDFINYVKPKKVIGLTATPYRLHTNSWGSSIKLLTRTRPKIFKDLIHVTQTKELVDAGFLVNPIFTESEGSFHARNLLQLNSTGANYTDKSVARYLSAMDIKTKVVQNVIEAVENYSHLLVFTESIADSYEICNRLENLGISVATVDSNTKPKDRQQLLEAFKQGDIKVMVNVGVLTTGFDFPELDCLIIARPTMSLALWYQMVGRCVRPHDNKKEAHVYDLCGNYTHFGNPLSMELKKKDGKLWDIYSGGKRITTRFLDEVNVGAEEVMGFGKYKGTPMSQVPTNYLEWCIENLSFPDTVQMMKEELERRNEEQ